MTLEERANAFWDFIDERYIVRRFLLMIVFSLTVHSYFWATNFASTTEKTGAEVGLIIAAVTAPISLLMGHIAALYNDGKKHGL